ncbi:glycosyltransferase family 4 protein, partial [Akkermansiaceae bacterium]|nr:glycosyltransferase family 4 protein [Akkermansiaceae bacterium]
ENRKNLEYIAKLGADIKVLSPSNFKGMIFDYDMKSQVIKGDGFEIRSMKTFVPFLAPQAAYIFRSFGLGLREFKPDVVHIECDPFSPVFVQTYFAAKIYAPQAKIVCTVKQNTYTSKGRIYDGLKNMVARVFVPRVSRFITVNQGVEDIYHTYFGASKEQMTRCTQLGVDTDTFGPVEPTEKKELLTSLKLERGDSLIGYVGRLVEYKGVFELVEAVRRLREHSGKNYQLALLGDGPDRARLEEMSSQDDWLQLAGVLPHERVAEFLKCLDAFVMPSRILKDHVEHDGHALLEAMAVGLPCIGTKCGAIEELLPGAGLLIAPEEIDVLYESLESLFANGNASLKMGAAARKRVQEIYSLEAVAKRYHEVYQRVLNSHVITYRR